MNTSDVFFAALDSALKESDLRFDPRLQLMRGVVGQVRYHTRLEPGTAIHATRESVEYASALFETRDPVRHALAEVILRKVLPMQDRNPESPSCGIWPWFYEEPLEKMSPPDWNWADFIGAPLAEMLLRNEKKMDPALAEDMRQSLYLAACAIRKRDVRLSYTNIAIMGTYVTIMAGTLLQDAGLLDYGKKRLRRFVEFTENYGGFPEYNSPAYAVICLIELSRMLRDFRDVEDLTLVNAIHERVWEEIAVHWHAPSRQWAGPHSRSYSTLLQTGALSYLQAGLGDRAVLTDEILPRPAGSILLPVHCPERFVSCFSEPFPRRSHRMSISEEKPVFEGCMHMEPGFVLSSAQRAVFWNQARGLVAYAPGEKGPVAMALRFLHDGYDFCCGNLLSRQEEGRVLAGVCLAHDRGDKHPELDRFPDRRIRASDWRLRLEFFNQSSALLQGPWVLGENRVLPFGREAWLGLRFLFARFGEWAPVFETGGDDNLSWIDLVLYQGEEREFLLADDFPAAVGLCLILSSDRAETETVVQYRALEKEGCWQLDGGGLRLEVPGYPSKEADIAAFGRSHNLTGAFMKL